MSKKLEWRQNGQEIIGYYKGMTFVKMNLTEKKVNFSFMGVFGAGGMFTDQLDYEKEKHEKLFQEMLKRMSNFKLEWTKDSHKEKYYCGKALIAIIRKHENSKNPKECWELKCFLPDELKCKPYNSFGQRKIMDKHIKKIEAAAKKIVEIFNS